MKVQMTDFSNPSVISCQLDKMTSKPERYRVTICKGGEPLFWHSENLPFKTAWAVGESMMHAYKIGAKMESPSDVRSIAA